MLDARSRTPKSFLAARRSVLRGTISGRAQPSARIPTKSNTLGVIVGESIRRGSVCSVDVGDVRGWNVCPLENGDWAWTAWTAASLGVPRSGIEPNEADAARAAQQEIERMLSEARAAALTRRELPVRDDRGNERQPQS
jgi:hypothetical protein